MKSNSTAPRGAHCPVCRQYEGRGRLYITQTLDLTNHFVRCYEQDTGVRISKELAHNTLGALFGKEQPYIEPILDTEEQKILDALLDENRMVIPEVTKDSGFQRLFVKCDLTEPRQLVTV